MCKVPRGTAEPSEYCACEGPRVFSHSGKKGLLTECLRKLYLSSFSKLELKRMKEKIGVREEQRGILFMETFCRQHFIKEFRCDLNFFSPTLAVKSFVIPINKGHHALGHIHLKAIIRQSKIGRHNMDRRKKIYF